MSKFHWRSRMPLRHRSNHRKSLSSRQGIPILQRLPYRRTKRPGGVLTGMVTAFRVLDHRPILVLDAFKRQEQGRRADGHLEIHRSVVGVRSARTFSDAHEIKLRKKPLAAF